MFTSVRFLQSMGIDDEIAAFFVNRKVPENNAFWQKRLLYLARGNGYLSIPVYYDLLYRIGVPKAQLLDEAHIQLMEQIMHFAILEETGKINVSTEIASINKLMEGRLKNEPFHKELLTYFEQPVLKPMGRLGLPVSALNRADAFLFILSDLPLSDLQTNNAITYWYATHGSYLLSDDMVDYDSDKLAGEDNALLQLGGGKESFEKAIGLLRRNVDTLADISPLLSRSFEDRINLLLEQIS